MPCTTRKLSVAILPVAIVAVSMNPTIGKANPQPAYDVATVDILNNVNDAQQLPVETNYLPHVVEAENGAGPMQSLMAQAIAARSYLYYSLNTAGFIGDGQNAQVYTNPSLGPPDAAQIAAVQLTDRMILRYGGSGSGETTIASFYAAGEIPLATTSPFGFAPPSGGGNAATQPDITYNRGLTGNNIHQTPQGFITNPPSGNILNRGSLSQNGANFLADNGWDYLDILRYYYGADIQVEIAAIPADGSVPAPITIEGFDVDQGTFGNGYVSPNNTNVASATRSYVTSGTLPGSAGAQQIAISPTTGGDFKFFDVSGLGPNSTQMLDGVTPGQGVVGTASTNISMQSIGSISFWLKADSTSGAPDLTASLLLDDTASNGSETGFSQSVPADGQWHEYTWLLNDPADWSNFGTGNTSTYFSINSIELTGAADATFTLDDVVYNAAAPVPEPSSIAAIGVLSIVALRRRRAIR